MLTPIYYDQNSARYYDDFYNLF